MGPLNLLFLVFFPILAAPGVYIARHAGGRTGRDFYVRVVPMAELLVALFLLLQEHAAAEMPNICGMGLTFAAGGLRTLLVLLAAILWQASGLASPSYFPHGSNSNRYYVYWLLTEGALMGVFLAGDLFTLYVFFEIMSFASYVWVAQNETPEALRAADTYLAIAVAGGMALLAGLMLLYHLLGTLTIGELRAVITKLPPSADGMLYTAGGLCLAGFGAKAGMFPLHIWLPKAHPVAPAPASALLSCILTKSGIFGALVLCRELFWDDVVWNNILLALAVITMVLGAVLAVFSIDLKRTLACSSMSQIGFILVGAAMQGLLNGENALASMGTVLHMMNHSLIKMVLFISAGVIYIGTHSLDLNKIRGWGRDKPFLEIVFLFGAASIAGVPGFSGYISKTLLHESIVEYIHVLHSAEISAGVYHVVEWLFLISGGLTAAYMTKLFIAIFVQPTAPCQHPTEGEYIAEGVAPPLGFAAAIMCIFGLLPHDTMEPIARWAARFLHADPMTHAVPYYGWENLKGGCISLTIGALVYLLFIRKVLMTEKNGETTYLNRWPKKLDLEELVYRPALHGLAFVGAFCARILASAGDFVVMIGERILFARAPGIFVPKKDENFGAYSHRPRRILMGDSFVFELLAACLGVVLILLCVML